MIAKEPQPPLVALAITMLLALPKIIVASSHKCVGPQDALVDYLRSVLLTSEEYITAMEEKACHQEEARVENQCKNAVDKNMRKKQEKTSRELNERHRRNCTFAFKARWTKEAI